MSGNMWDKRFSSEKFVYGNQPNAYFKEVLDGLAPGKILIPGEGEGRNALYAAKKDWDVYAFDSSMVGREKALKLAEEHSVSINYEINDYLNYQSSEKFDAIALIFTHMPSVMRRMVHQKYEGFLKDGGTLIMQVFNKEQLGHTSGGPQNTDLLFSIEELEGDFRNLSSFQAENHFSELNEGPYHQGLAHLISVEGIK